MNKVIIEPNAYLHPMLEEVSVLLEYIIDDPDDDPTNEERWKSILAMVNTYLEGRWQATCWRLLAIYGVYNKGKLTHTFSVLVTRNNGRTKVESGNEVLLSSLERLVATINKFQTDEWFIRNLTLAVPQNVDGLKLQSAQVLEQLS